MTASDPKDPQKRKEKEEKAARREDEKIREAAHDHTVAESMVASDPPSSIPDPRDEDALEEQAHPPVKREEDEKE